MIYLLTVHLYDEGALEDVLTALASLGVENAVVLDGQRMSRVLAFDVPIFAGFREEIGGSSSYCKYITALVDDEKVIDELASLLRQAGVDFEKPGTGRMYIIPVHKSIGAEEDFQD
jgi:hypothetical protein